MFGRLIHLSIVVATASVLAQPVFSQVAKPKEQRVREQFSGKGATKVLAEKDALTRALWSYGQRAAAKRVAELDGPIKASVLRGMTDGLVVGYKCISRSSDNLLYTVCVEMTIDLAQLPDQTGQRQQQAGAPADEAKKLVETGEWLMKRITEGSQDAVSITADLLANEVRILGEQVELPVNLSIEPSWEKYKPLQTEIVNRLNELPLLQGVVTSKDRSAPSDATQGIAEQIEANWPSPVRLGIIRTSKIRAPKLQKAAVATPPIVETYFFMQTGENLESRTSTWQWYRWMGVRCVVPPPTYLITVNFLDVGENVLLSDTFAVTTSLIGIAHRRVAQVNSEAIVMGPRIAVADDTQQNSLLNVFSVLGGLEIERVVQTDLKTLQLIEKIKVQTKTLKIGQAPGPRNLLPAAGAGE